MFTFRHFYVGLLLLGLVSSITAQHLRRQASFGFQPLLVNDSIAQAHQLKRAEGMLLLQVTPSGTFGQMGAQAGDVLLAINGQAMQQWPDLMGLRRSLAEGDRLSVRIFRGGKAMTLDGKAVGIPKEGSTSQFEVEYGEAPFEGGYLRTIVNRPRKPGPHPAIYFIPGYTCATVDALPALHPYAKLVDSLARLDYLVFRVEKPGVGDGPQPCDCAETGFDKEMKVFEAGYDQLLKTKGVDPEKVFIFGHSLGGIQAPILAAQPRYQPAGIAVYGTVFQSWYEYILGMLRFQQPRIGDDYLELEAKMQTYTQLFFQHYVLHKPLEDIIANPDWKALLEKDFGLDAAGNILGRKSFYWGEIAQRNLTKAWAETEAKVLSIYGEADFEVFNAYSMSEIAQIVNHYHPGNATYTTLPGTNHSFIHVGSMEKEISLKGNPAYRQYLIENFDYKLIDVLHEWIQGVLHAGS